MRIDLNNRQIKLEIESFQVILFNSINNKRNKDESIPLLTTIHVNSTTVLKLANSSYISIQQKQLAFALSKAIQLNYCKGLELNMQ